MLFKVVVHVSYIGSELLDQHLHMYVLPLSIFQRLVANNRFIVLYTYKEGTIQKRYV